MAVRAEAERTEEADQVAEWLDAIEPGVLACWNWLIHPDKAARGAAWREQANDIEGLLGTDVGCLWRLWIVHCPARGSSIAVDRDAFEPKRRGLSGELWAQDGPCDDWTRHTHGARAARADQPWRPRLQDGKVALCRECEGELHRPPARPAWARGQGADLDMPCRALANDLLAAVPRDRDGQRPGWFAKALARPGERAFLAGLAVYSAVCNLRRGAAPRQKGRLGECIAFPQHADLPDGALPHLVTFVQEGPAPPPSDNPVRDAALRATARRELERQGRRAVGVSTEWPVNADNVREGQSARCTKAG